MFAVVLMIVLAAASWLMRDTTDLLVGPRESPVNAAGRVAPSGAGRAPQAQTDPEPLLP